VSIVKTKKQKNGKMEKKAGYAPARRVVGTPPTHFPNPPGSVVDVDGVVSS
jgi:hypothetical protein